MNHTYRLVWNDAVERHVPVAETARARKKGPGGNHVARNCAIVVAAALSGTLASNTRAAPTGGTVVAGQAAINQTGATTTVQQQSQTASINWQGFSIGSQETVQFVQPSATAVALNRVVGNDPSEIYGHLLANGQIFLVNPKGVLFGPSAQVNVGGLVASSLNISDEDFLAGNYRFHSRGSKSDTGSAPASVINQGSLTAASGGSVALLGGQVSNSGTITAQLGTVALAAGSAMTLDFQGNRLLNVQVDEAAAGALAENHQLIRADGGTVIMTAAARNALLNTVVNNTGIIEARTIDDQSGEIKLLGSQDSGTSRSAAHWMPPRRILAMGATSRLPESTFTSLMGLASRRPPRTERPAHGWWTPRITQSLRLAVISAAPHSAPNSRQPVSRCRPRPTPEATFTSTTQ
jgi:filamentous hemagglutinin family protein